MSGVRVLGRDLRARLERDVGALGGPLSPGALITEDEVAALPAVVGRYLRFMGVVGQPAVRSFRAHLRCRFRFRQGQSFMPAEVWQYNSVAPIARVFWMRIDMAGGLLPMVGRDSYLAGRGRMLGKLFDTIVVADGQGEPFDVGELTTWLNDAVLLAPSMLVAAGATFEPVDQTSFDVHLSDSGRTVRARVTVDERGAPLDFRSNDRYADLPGGPVRALWSTPVAGWQVVAGRAIPTRGSAVWHLPEGEFAYGVADFAPDSIETDPALGGTPPVPPRPSGVLDAMSGAAAIAVMLLTAPVVRQRFNRWGASDAECRSAMPGDDLVPEPRLSSTRAITIDAPPAAVWPWLLQLGQGRGGLYSYDGLENLLGLDIHSAGEILPAHQHLAPGDTVRLGKPGSPAFSVVQVDPGRSLVLISADPATGEPVGTPVRDGTGATWQWQLRPVRDGRATRLISRQRTTHPDGQRLLWRLVEPIGFVMERRMLLGIKDRCERAATAQR